MSNCDNDDYEYSDYRKGNTIFDTEYFYRKEIVRNYRDEIIDSLIVTSKGFDSFLEGKIPEENIYDLKRDIVSLVCVFLKQSNSISDIREGLIKEIENILYLFG
jgi:hypothetical protein